ncbi:MAG TPA: M4 family metallopeptidase [Vicinamibacterales bacterium]|nr:M4 family metallopeptidase [Vicinamibacterales bacterium]
MTRLTAAVVAGAAFLLWMDVGSAQQPSSMRRIAATSVNDLRTWDQYVTAGLRTGDLRVASVEQDPSLPSRVVERMQQLYEGVPVFGAEIVRDSQSGVAQSIFGEVPQNFSIETRPALDAATAERAMMAAAGPGARLARRMELTILPMTDGAQRLAYSAIVATSDNVLRFFVDANTGAELLRFTEIHTQSAVGTGQGLVGGTKKLSVRSQAAGFVADDRLRPPLLTTYDLRGDLNRTVNVAFGGAPLFPADLATDADNVWTDIPTVDAHAYIGWTYDYYFKRHGRRGLDNRDRPILTLVNGLRRESGADPSIPPDLFGLFVVNAFWCGACGPDGVGLMYFGNGFPPNVVFQSTGQNWGFLAGSLDVAAHELTHAVTESTSNLIYVNESGALNESFSDIMGTSVEFFYQPVGAGVGQADFILAEDSVRTPSGAGLQGIRSMVNPIAFGDPDHYSIRFTGTGDNGGVHINSAIPNHAFFLAIAGGTNRVSGLPIAGVGLSNMEQIEKVFYRAFTLLMPANSTFATARAATIQAARDLYGPTGPVVNAVTQAWTAVGVN